MIISREDESFMPRHRSFRKRMIAFVGVIATTACASANSLRQPAALASTDTQTMANVQKVLAGAMKVAHVRLGAGDLTKESTIAVLPPPLSEFEDRSTVTPDLFDIFLENQRCYVMHRKTGDVYPLEGVSCVPL